MSKPSQSKPKIAPFFVFLIPRRFVILLIFLLLVTLINPLFDFDFWGRFIGSIIFGISLFTCSMCVSRKPHTIIITAFLGALTSMLSVACFSLYELDPAPGLEFRLVTRVVILTYLLVVGIAILRDVFLEENVDYNIICGALCIYFIVGLLFSHLYQLVYDLHPACFHIDWQRLGLDEPNNPIVRSHLLAYYSFITLGTVGCGDVTPTGPITRTLSWFEAVLGQIYLTVLVARLVGMYVVGITTKNRDDLSIESTRLAD